MAELIWKGKPGSSRTGHEDDCSDAATSPIPYQLLTNERYLPSSADDITSPLPGPETQDNLLIYGDKSIVLPALLPEFAASVPMIYIDPPFMTGRTFTSGTQLGTQMAYQDIWGNDLDSYLQWLHETFTLLYRLLSPTGSLYVHLDWRASHYARVLLDEIFGSSLQGNGAGFKNEIIWHYQSGGRAQHHFARKHDTILLYTKSSQYCFHTERVGERRGTQKRNHMRKTMESDGRVTWTIRSNGRVYSYNEDSLLSPSDVWSDINHLHQRDPERTGYATQKPEALLKRIILASSEENDLILDCCCGSGVTAVVAEQLGRRWIACDQSKLAISTTCTRLLAMPRQRPFRLLVPHQAPAPL